MLTVLILFITSCTDTANASLHLSYNKINIQKRKKTVKQDNEVLHLTFIWNFLFLRCGSDRRKLYDRNDLYTKDR